MRIRFEVANFRSILDPVELSMGAVDRDRDEARYVPNIGESLLSVAAVYGPNASGKSNIVAALAWLQAAVRESLRSWDDEIPVEPFAFADGEHRPIEFAVEFIVDDVRFEYTIELERDAVRYEALFHYPEKKRRRIFERDGSDLKLQRGLGSLSGTRELLTDRTLALSAARRFGEPLVSRFAREVLATQVFGASRFFASRRWLLSGLARPTVRWFEDQADRDQLSIPEIAEIVGTAEQDRAQALALLRLADLGIDDVLIDDYEAPLSSAAVERGALRGRRRTRLLHRTASGKVPLDFEAESEGTGPGTASSVRC